MEATFSGSLRVVSWIFHRVFVKLTPLTVIKSFVEFSERYGKMSTALLC